MSDPKMVTNPRPLPERRPLKYGAKVKWHTTSFRMPPDLHKFLQEDARVENVDMGYIVLELLEQYRAFKTAKKRGRPK